MAITGVYLLLLALGVCWGLTYKLADFDAAIKPWMVVAGVLGIAAAFLGVRALVLGWRAASAAPPRMFYLPVAASVIGAAIAVAVVEVTTRVIAEPHPLGWRIGNKVLLPYDWDATKAYNKALLKRARDGTSYYIESQHLGWTIGPSRRSANGMYLSSAEGLRSARQGEKLLATRPAARIAIFGDSFAFSEEVPFEESLGVHLERRLADGTQVLTFGVPGFGVGQAVLRFEHEAARWKPDVSVLQFIADDIERIGNIYLFNKPDWALPFVKPRFVEGQSGLTRLALPTPDEVFASASVFDLPHLEFDIEFEKYEWRPFLLSNSYAMRLIASLSPRVSVKRTDGSAASNEQLAVALIERFVAGARAIGSIPLVVFFPDASNIEGEGSPKAQRVISTLAGRGIGVVDLSACMREGGGVERLIVGGGGGRTSEDEAALMFEGVGEYNSLPKVHYSDAGNARMAHCLAPLVQGDVLGNAKATKG